MMRHSSLPLGLLTVLSPYAYNLRIATTATIGPHAGMRNGKATRLITAIKADEGLEFRDFLL